MKKNIFEIMVGMQHQFNKQVAEDYLDKEFNWNSAIIAESGELLESLGYKWWKRQEPDMENVKVEAIDLLHFIISKSLQSFYNKQSKKDVFLEKTIDDFHFCFQNDFNFIYKIKAYIVSFLLGKYDIENLISRLVKVRTSVGRFQILKIIFDKLEMTNEDVYIAYITKNCLNKFRQDFGYKDGTYIKEWQGREDNIVAFELANKIGATENLFKELYDDLKKIYVCNVAFASSSINP